MQDSISSQPADTLPRYERVVALGRKLVDELGKDPHPDTLSRWMAHYVAELIDTADIAPPDERAAARRRCFEAILELWSHRADLPHGRRPLEDLEPIARALESLDPDNETPRVFRTIRTTIDKADEGQQTRFLFDFVDRVDSTARILIGCALADAARSAVDNSREWVALAEQAGSTPGVAGVVVSFVSKRAEHDEQTEQTQGERAELADRIERLEGFAKLAEVFANDLKARLNVLGGPPDSSDSGLDSDTA